MEVLSYRNQFIDLRRKSMDWFLHNKDLDERVNTIRANIPIYFNAFLLSAVVIFSSTGKC